MVLCCELTGFNSPTKSQFYRPYVRARLVSSLTPGLRTHGGRKRMVWVRGFPPLRRKNVARMGARSIGFFSGEPGRGTQRAPTSPGLCRQLRQGREAEARFGDGSADNLDSVQVARAYTQMLGEREGAVAIFKGRRAAIDHWIEAHHRGGDCIRRDAVHAGDQPLCLSVRA